MSKPQIDASKCYDALCSGFSSQSIQRSDAGTVFRQLHLHARRGLSNLDQLLSFHQLFKRLEHILYFTLTLLRAQRLFTFLNFDGFFKVCQETT